MKNNLFLKLFFGTIGGIALNAQINSSKLVSSQNFNTQNGLNLFESTTLSNLIINESNEELNLRDANSKHFKNSDGSYVAVISAAPIHYKNNGNWVEINTDLIKEADGFVNRTNSMVSYFGDSSHKGLTSITIEGSVREFQNVKFYFEKNGQIINLVNAPNSLGTAISNQLIFENIYNDVDARYTIESGRRKLDFIVPSLSALGSIPNGAQYFVISEQIELPINWSIAQTNYGWNVLNEKGMVVYLYHNANTYDSKDFGLFNNNTNMEVTQHGNIVTLQLKVNVGYLTDSKRVFPITIDPTTTVYPNNEDFWTVQVNSAGNGQSGLPASGQASSGTWYRGFITFNTSSIPASDITNAEINLTTLNKVGNFDSTYAIGITQSDYDLPVWSETFLDLYDYITNPANTAGDYVAISNPANINSSATYNLGSVARNDIAKKTGGANSFFSVSLRQGWDGGNPEDRYVVFGGHDNGSAVPKLILTYTPNDNYCHPSHIYANCAALGDCEYIGIAKVELNEINSTTTYNNIPLGYNRYTSTAEVYTNESYSLKVTYKDNGQPINQGLVAAWADWNNDGSFGADEYLGVSNPLNNNQVHTFNFTVPSYAGLTVTRLRVRSVYNDETLAASMACDSKEYGETEDYLISVQKSIMDTNELNALNFKVYPNPTQDRINVDSKIKVLSLDLYSLTGQKLLSSKGRQMNLNSLPAGNYILKIKTADFKEFNHKVIKK